MHASSNKVAHHPAEVEDAANDVKAGVLEAEEVQVLTAQLHAAGGGGVGGCTVVLPTPPQLRFFILLCFYSCCRSGYAQSKADMVCCWQRSYRLPY